MDAVKKPRWLRGEWDYDPRWEGASIPENLWHFHRQLYVRYRAIMRPGDFSDMVTGIREGRAVVVRPRSAGKQPIYGWRLKTTGHLIFVVGNKRQVFTVLPAENRFVTRYLSAARPSADAQSLTTS